MALKGDTQFSDVQRPPSFVQVRELPAFHQGLDKLHLKTHQLSQQHRETDGHGSVAGLPSPGSGGLLGPGGWLAALQERNIQRCSCLTQITYSHIIYLADLPPLVDKAPDAARGPRENKVDLHLPPPALRSKVLDRHGQLHARSLTEPR
jgi:hypothetical protein